VKFSEGIRFIKCFCLLVSCNCPKESVFTFRKTWQREAWCRKGVANLLYNVIYDRIGILQICGEYLVLLLALRNDFMFPQILPSAAHP
jgi:hypothetical protein